MTGAKAEAGHGCHAGGYGYHGGYGYGAPRAAYYGGGYGGGYGYTRVHSFYGSPAPYYGGVGPHCGFRPPRGPLPRRRGRFSRRVAHRAPPAPLLGTILPAAESVSRSGSDPGPRRPTFQLPGPPRGLSSIASAGRFLLGLFGVLWMSGPATSMRGDVVMMTQPHGLENHCERVSCQNDLIRACSPPGYNTNK